MSLLLDSLILCWGVKPYNICSFDFWLVDRLTEFQCTDLSPFLWISFLFLFCFCECQVPRKVTVVWRNKKGLLYVMREKRGGWKMKEDRIPNVLFSFESSQYTVDVRSCGPWKFMTFQTSICYVIMCFLLINYLGK